MIFEEDTLQSSTTLILQVRSNTTSTQTVDTETKA